MTILAGDLGGTKTLLALCDDRGQVLRRQRFASQSHPNLESMVAEFLASLGDWERPERAAIGVAGPVVSVGTEQLCEVTNLPYRISSSSLGARFGLRQVRLVNDFYAVAVAISAVARGESFAGLSLHALNPSGVAVPGAPIAVLGAGTGLGEAVIAFHGEEAVILPTEGGHSDFAPHDELELALWRFLARRHPEHISQERLICGAGIVTLYEFFRQQNPGTESRQVAAELASAPDAAGVISRHALAHSDQLCELALTRFAQLYGEEAGNLALKSLARGGVYLAGGIAAKNLPLFVDGLFLSHFTRKGRFAELLRSIPVYIVQCEEIGLLGAAQVAVQLSLRD
jgi:glucokinase